MICALVLPDYLQAQTWVPPRDEVSVTTSYQYVTITKHYDWHGGEWDRGHIRADSLALGFDYGMTDRLAFSISVPYIASSYSGTRPHPTPIDDGSTHTTFQDYHVGLRYNIVKGRVVVTPFAGLVAPTHNYTYFAHSAVGRDLHEQNVGVSVGVPVEPVYLQVRYGYSFVERVLDIPHNKSNADLDVGYFVSPSFLVRVLASGQKTHGGINIDYENLPARTSPLFLHHDQIITDDFLNVGAGASYELNQSVAAFAVAFRSIWGRNGHKMDLGVTTGIDYSFNGRHAIDRLERRLIGRK